MAEGNAHSHNLLIEHNLRLVAHIVKKFDNTGEDLEDLISIGMIGLIKAIDEAGDVRRPLHRERDSNAPAFAEKMRKDVSLHDPIGTDKEGNEITLGFMGISSEAPAAPT
jgi:RNA polymerase sporulation-specific sigma factor